MPFPPLLTILKSPRILAILAISIILVPMHFFINHDRFVLAKISSPTISFSSLPTPLNQDTVLAQSILYLDHPSGRFHTKVYIARNLLISPLPSPRGSFTRSDSLIRLVPAKDSTSQSLGSATIKVTSPSNLILRSSQGTFYYRQRQSSIKKSALFLPRLFF